MSVYIIDPSVALSWLLPDEANVLAEEVRFAIEQGAKAWIPSH